MMEIIIATVPFFSFIDYTPKNYINVKNKAKRTELDIALDVHYSLCRREL